MLLFFFPPEVNHDSAVCLLLPENTFCILKTAKQAVAFKKLLVQTSL